MTFDEAFHLLKSLEITSPPSEISQVLQQIYHSWDPAWPSTDERAGFLLDPRDPHDEFTKELRCYLRLAPIRTFCPAIQEIIAYQDPYGFLQLLVWNCSPHHLERLRSQRSGHRISTRAIRRIAPKYPFGVAQSVRIIRWVEQGDNNKLLDTTTPLQSVPCPRSSLAIRVINNSELSSSTDMWVAPQVNR